MKILMVGNKDSGKTTYMVSSFCQLEGGVEGFYVETDNDTKKRFSLLFDSIKDGQYPDATNKRENYNFKLYYKRQKLLDFDWVDYNGGIITEQSVQKFKVDVNSADGIMIFLEAEALLENRSSVHKLRRIIALIHEQLENYDKPLLSVIIVLTKYDCIPPKISFEEVTKSLQSFMDAIKNNDKIYARIVPVSCTDKGFFNVELPLLDVLDSGLQIENLKNVVAAQENINVAQQCADNSGLIDTFICFFSGEPTYEELAMKHIEEAKKRVEMFESLKEPMEQLKQFTVNYEITFPNVATPRAASSQTSRGRFIRF